MVNEVGNEESEMLEHSFPREPLQWPDKDKMDQDRRNQSFRVTAENSDLFSLVARIKFATFKICKPNFTGESGGYRSRIFLFLFVLY